MIDDIATSVKAILYDRAKSPFWGAYAISWLVVNFQFLLVLFSDNDLRERLEILSYVYTSPLKTVLYFLIPVLAALFYILLWPRLDKHLISCWARLQKEVAGARMRAEGIQPMDPEVARELRALAGKERAESDAQIEKKEERIKSLGSQLEIKTQSLEDALQRLSNYFPLGNSIVTDSEIKEKVGKGRFMLVFDPEREHGCKFIKFHSDGHIGDGNDNESSWRIRSGKLELLQSGGMVHSRFYFFPELGLFINKPGEDNTKTKNRQFIVSVPKLDEAGYEEL